MFSQHKAVARRWFTAVHNASNRDAGQSVSQRSTTTSDTLICKETLVELEPYYIVLGVFFFAMLMANKTRRTSLNGHGYNVILCIDVRNIHGKRRAEGASIGRFSFFGNRRTLHHSTARHEDASKRW